MEFENYERELKYLIKKNEKYTSKQFLEFLCENGYKLVESFEKEKHVYLNHPPSFLRII